MTTIATYTDLKNAIGNYLDHSLFSGSYDQFI
jgi:hypothetical protein